MKTKNKIIASVEIAVVLCSLFLVAMPAIAAEQTTQEASASTITTASEDDYVLGIYGNANEDDTIDMRDLTYVKLIFFGKKPETELADAKYDGKINPLDFIQIKLIIVGKEKELTLIDQADRIVTIPKPVERAVTFATASTRAIVSLGAHDRLVAISHCCYCKDWSPHYEGQFVELPSGRKLCELPDTGKYWTNRVEFVASLKPDVGFVFSGWLGKGADKGIPEKTGAVAVAATGGDTIDDIYNTYRIMGAIFDKEEEAEEMISFMEEKIAKVTDVTSSMPDSEKPRVYIAVRAHGGQGGKRGDLLTTHGYYEPIDLAGGINVAKEAAHKGSYRVSKEQVIAWNPDIILLSRSSVPLGEEVDFAAQDLYTDPLYQTINAVRNKKVYYTTCYSKGTPQHRHLANVLYYAKIFYPDKFEDLDLEKEGNEIFERCMGIDGLYTWHADDLGFIREFIESQK